MTVESLEAFGERIKLAFAEEQRAARPVTQLDELPFSYSD